MSNRMYDFCKMLVTKYLPATGAFIFAINKIWNLGLPSEEIVATIEALCVLLGVYMNISSKEYYKSIEIEEQES